MTTPFTIETRGVSFSYQEGSLALDSVDFRVRPGEFVAMLASNGSGKTTLIKVLMGLLKAQEGTVLIEGKDLRELPARELYQQVGLVFQNPDDQLFAATVEEDVAFGPRNLNLPEQEVQKRVAEIARGRRGLSAAPSGDPSPELRRAEARLARRGPRHGPLNAHPRRADGRASTRRANRR